MHQSTQLQGTYSMWQPGTRVRQPPSNQVIVIQSVLPYDGSPLDVLKLERLRRVGVLLVVFGILSFVPGIIGIFIQGCLSFTRYGIWSGTLVRTMLIIRIIMFILYTF